MKYYTPKRGYNLTLEWVPEYHPNKILLICVVCDRLYRERPLTLRVQVPNNHIPTQNLYYKYYYLKPKYQIIGYIGLVMSSMISWRVLGLVVRV